MHALAWNTFSILLVDMDLFFQKMLIIGIRAGVIMGVNITFVYKKYSVLVGNIVDVETYMLAQMVWQETTTTGAIAPAQQVTTAPITCPLRVALAPTALLLGPLRRPLARPAIFVAQINTSPLHAA